MGGKTGDALPSVEYNQKNTMGSGKKYTRAKRSCSRVLNVS